MGRIPKLLLFTMLAYKDFLGPIETNPYKFRSSYIRDVRERQTDF